MSAFHDLSKKNQILFVAWMDEENQDQWIDDYQAEERYLEFLNEIYEPVRICGYDYLQGDALKALDPIAFRCGLSDYCSEELIEITSKSSPSTTLYLPASEIDSLVEDFEETLNEDEE